MDDKGKSDKPVDEKKAAEAEKKKVHKFGYKMGENFYNQYGQQIQERTVVFGTPPPEFAKFVGRALVDVKTNQGVFQEPFVFPIPADTVEAAFDMFEARAKEEVPKVLDKMKKAADAQSQAKTNIITPGAMIPPEMGPLPGFPGGPLGGG